MRRLLLVPFALLCLGAAPTAAAPPERPSDAALRRAWERNAHTVVEVWGTGRGRRGAGVIVGAGGHVATSTHNVDLYEATVKVDGRELRAKVLSADARTRIAILEIPLDGGQPLRAPEARVDAPLRRALWLLGISPAGAATKPSAGRIVEAPNDRRPHFLTDLALPPGSPLFDERGRLVALVVERAGRQGSLAIPLARVQAQAKQGEAP